MFVTFNDVFVTLMSDVFVTLFVTCSDAFVTFNDARGAGPPPDIQRRRAAGAAGPPAHNHRRGVAWRARLGFEMQQGFCV